MRLYCEFRHFIKNYYLILPSHDICKDKTVAMSDQGLCCVSDKECGDESLPGDPPLPPGGGGWQRPQYQRPQYQRPQHQRPQYKDQT